MTKKENLELSAPWVIYHEQIIKLFSKDKEVSISDIEKITEKNYKFDIYCSNADKTEALSKIMKHRIEYGDIVLTIDFIYNNSEKSGAEYFETAFRDNPYFRNITEVRLLDGSELDYIVFSRDILSCYADDLSDCCGLQHQIVAEFIKEATNWEKMDVQVCTEAPLENEN